jgi:hypothetical protein
MLAEELLAATPFRYLCADSAYGRDPGLRDFCHQHEVSYVPAVPLVVPLIAARGDAEPVGHVLDRLLAHGDSSIWERRACGSGTKGLRLYDWSAITVTVCGQNPTPGDAHTLLIRRSAGHDRH